MKKDLIRTILGIIGSVLAFFPSLTDLASVWGELSTHIMEAIGAIMAAYALIVSAFNPADDEEPIKKNV